MSGVPVRAEMSADELMALARKVRPCVMLIMAADESGRVIGSGTGFIVSADGKLVTNRHVAKLGPRLVAKAPGGRQYHILGALAEDSDQDLVVLQVEDCDLPPVPLGSSSDVREGTPVVMIGNPLEMESTVQQGTVAGYHQFLGARRWLEISGAVSSRHAIDQQIIHGQGLQVVTTVAPGSSGSPVLDTNGNVLGVVTAIYRSNDVLALAIPVETVKELVNRAAQADRPQPLGELTRRGAGNDLSMDAEFGAALKAYKDGDLEEAEQKGKAVISRYPDSAPARQFLGQIYLQRHAYTEAADLFERAIALKRDLASAWAGLAVADAQLNLLDRARDCVRELQKIDPAMAHKLTESNPALTPP